MKKPLHPQCQCPRCGEVPAWAKPVDPPKLFESEYISICECCGCAMTFDEEMKLTFLPKDQTETLLSVPEVAENMKALYERWRRTKGS